MIRPLSIYQIQNMAYASHNGEEFLLRLYEYAVPDFSIIPYIDTYPAISHAMADYICKLGMRLFGANHFLLLWLNKGFSAKNNMADHMVQYKED